MSLPSESRHIVNLSANGRLNKTGNLYTPASTLQDIFDGFEASGKSSITIYFHGGLNDESVGLDLAHHLYPKIEEEFDSYPIFFVWETGVFETLRSELQDLSRNSALFNKLVGKLMKHAARYVSKNLPSEEFAMSWDFDGPSREMLLEDLENELPIAVDDIHLDLLAIHPAMRPDEVSEEAVDALLEDLDDDDEAGELLMPILTKAVADSASGDTESSSAGSEEHGYLNQSIINELVQLSPPLDESGSEEALFGLPMGIWAFAGKVLVAIGKRYADGTDHGFYATVLEELYRHVYMDKIGTFLWNGMKENALEAYDDNPAGSPTDDFSGGTLFIDLLNAHMKANGAVDVNLIGHSAGSIHICHFVERALQTFGDGFKFRNILFLAPAVTFEQFNESIVANPDCTELLRIYTMTDTLERKDPLLKGLPTLFPHSLLYVVSGLLEDKADTPILGLARHLRGKRYDGHPAVKRTRRYLAERSESLIYSPSESSAEIDKRSTFTSHGGANGPNNDEPTLTSLTSLIQPQEVDEETFFEDVSMESAAPEVVDYTLEMDDYDELMMPSRDVLLPNANPVSTESPRTTVNEDPSFSFGVVDDEIDPIDMIDLDGGNDGTTRSAPVDVDSEVAEAIIGTNEIIDHGLIERLMTLGRSVGRIKAPAIRGFTKVEPSERQAVWTSTAAQESLPSSFGTGWVFGSARRVILTNNHVLPLADTARDSRIAFGYQRKGPGEKPSRGVRIKFDPDSLFVTSVNRRFEGLDYTLIALAKPAPEQFGFIDYDLDANAEFADNIFVVQHPGGKPKAYVVNHNRKANISEKYVTYFSDTESGSSGSPLFDEDLNLVGIHHLGNFRVNLRGRQTFTNLGSRMEVVVADMIEQLKNMGWDFDQVEEFFGEGGFLDAFDEAS